MPKAKRGRDSNYMLRAISLDEAVRIIEGTFAFAAKHKLRPLAAIVLDAGGRVKAFLKQDGASLMRFEIAYGKALRRSRSGGRRGSCCRSRARSRSSWPIWRSSPTVRCS